MLPQSLVPSGRIQVERYQHFHHLYPKHNMSNQPQNKKTCLLSPSAIRNSWKSFRSHSSLSSSNAAQTQTGQNAHVSPSSTTSPLAVSRSPSPEGCNADVQSSPSAPVAPAGSSKCDKPASYYQGIYMPSQSLVDILTLS